MVAYFSLRRCFYYLLAVSAFLVLVVNLRQRDLLESTEEEADRPRRQNDVRSALDNTVAKSREAVLDKWLLENELFVSTPAAQQPLPWFFKGGVRYPLPAVRTASGHRKIKLWPQEDPGKDRIVNQLMFMPEQNETTPDAARLKKILLYNGLKAWSIFKPGRELFQHNKCPVDTCMITADTTESIDADAILFKDHLIRPEHNRPLGQVWILYFLECPYHTAHIWHNDVINWTATYRRDSDIVAPYERWTYYDERIKQWPGVTRNYAANKTHQVAWFVSNCGARNHRLRYALELQKYISVDIYGACGTKVCPREKANKCFGLLDTKYKFYLAFENSNCRDYITEKFFVNGLGRNILPIVMGARPEDYKASAPLNSFIHVDDFDSPAALANYLHELDANDEAYNSYFKWKGTGEFINTYFFCRLCALLHDTYPHKAYRNVNEWWRGPGTCRTGSWRDN